MHYKKKIASFFILKKINESNESNVANASAKASGCHIYSLHIVGKETLGPSKQLFGKPLYL